MVLSCGGAPCGCRRFVVPGNVFRLWPTAQPPLLFNGITISQRARHTPQPKINAHPVGTPTNPEPAPLPQPHLLPRRSAASRPSTPDSRRNPRLDTARPAPRSRCASLPACLGFRRALAPGAPRVRACFGSPPASGPGVSRIPTRAGFGVPRLPAWLGLRRASASGLAGTSACPEFRAWLRLRPGCDPATLGSWPDLLPAQLDVARRRRSPSAWLNPSDETRRSGRFAPEISVYKRRRAEVSLVPVLAVAGSRMTHGEVSSARVASGGARSGVCGELRRGTRGCACPTLAGGSVRGDAGRVVVGGQRRHRLRRRVRSGALAESKDSARFARGSDSVARSAVARREGSLTDTKERSNIEVDLSFVSVNDPSGMSGRDSTTTTPASARRCPSHGGNNPKFRADASGLRAGLAASDAEWATESGARGRHYAGSGKVVWICRVCMSLRKGTPRLNVCALPASGLDLVISESKDPSSPHCCFVRVQTAMRAGRILELLRVDQRRPALSGNLGPESSPCEIISAPLPHAETDLPPCGPAIRWRLRGVQSYAGSSKLSGVRC
ncbi:hypothetical protein J2S43_007730 [Catenuloplanes nepalensis]|uniref:Uncharacterized protein n=1 Tax=Catenuloplanes nepalensis TaxID=587533 RepID=A0ABT9N6R6_9ACTN|nr:hypothetical protein [Catenuloplanes nepalensis]